MATPFFDAAYYLAKNPDVLAAGYTLATAEQHYVKYGAAESVTGTGRAPNAWFDARAYLIAYPDLLASGVTAATAFYHYITYGINEGRSPAANLNPAAFSYADYAASNVDLRTAFGITDTAHLTANQQHQLLGQFLSYGIHESRPGAESIDGTGFFAQFDIRPPVSSAPPPPPALPPIVVDHAGIFSGTNGDDVFTATAVTLNGSTLDGKLGNDTLQATLGVTNTSVTLNSIENLVVTTDTFFAFLSVNGSGLNSITVTNPGQIFEYNGPNVGSFNLLANGASTNVSFTNGQGADPLNINVAAGITTNFTARFITNLAVNLGAGANLTLSSSLVSAPVSVALTGGAAHTTSTFAFNFGAAAQVNLDGSAVAGDLILSVIPSGGASPNQTLTAGAGNDTLTGSTSLSGTATLNGGAGDDILVASTGQDLMTGGSGNDVFRFGLNTTLSYLFSANQVDTILDFAPGDNLTFAGTSSGGLVSLVGNDLNAMLASIETTFGGTHNQNLLFKVSGDLYFMNTGDGSNPSAVVKILLAGGADPTHVVTDNFGVHFSA